MDRRIKHTKLRLKNSLVELLKEYSISEISIKKLCETADINRSTFYSHYTDPFDLLQQLEQEIFEELMELISHSNFSQQSTQTAEVMDMMLRYIKENADLFNVLLSENGDISFQKDIIRITQQKSISELQNDEGIDTRTSSYIQSFEIAGGLSVVRKWLVDGMVESTHEMSELMTKLIYRGLYGVTN